MCGLGFYFAMKASYVDARENGEWKVKCVCMFAGVCLPGTSDLASCFACKPQLYTHIDTYYTYIIYLCIQPCQAVGKDINFFKKPASIAFKRYGVLFEEFAEGAW